MVEPSRQRAGKGSRREGEGREEVNEGRKRKVAWGWAQGLGLGGRSKEAVEGCLNGSSVNGIIDATVKVHLVFGH